jgi:lipid-A-disaccharide synthase-like uncharacterized protein
MKFSLKFYKKIGVVFSVLGIIMLGYFKKDGDSMNTEVLVRCLGAFIFIVGGTALIYANEQQNNKHDNSY